MSKNNRKFFVKKKLWSEVKDELLACYLKPYFSKVLSMKKPILYVDCFAGKGRFDDGKNGSPLVAVKALESSLESYCHERSGGYLPDIKMCFIELNHANELRKNLANQSANRCEIIEGKFEDHIIPILQKNQQNTHHLLYFFILTHMV